MPISAILPLIGAIFLFLLGFFVLYKNKGSIANITFFLLSLCLTIWLLGTSMMFLSKTDEGAIFWDRFIYAGVVFIPTFLYHFSLAFAGKIKEQKKLLFLGYIFSFIFLILSRTNYFVSGVFKYQWGVHAKAQFFHHIFLGVFFIYVLLFFFNIYKCYRTTTTAIKRSQAKYIFLTIFVLTIGSLAFLPAYGISIHPFVFVAEIGGAIILAYAIVKYRLMDIRVVMGKGAIYVFSFLSVIGTSFLLINTKLAQSISFNVLFPITIIAAVLLFKIFFWLFEKLGSKYFYYTFYSYQTVLTDLGRRLTQVLDLSKLSALIASTLIRTMKLDRTIILLRNPETGDYQIQKNIGFEEENGISLVRENFLTRYLEKTQNPLVYEEISLVIRDIKDEKERKNLESLKKSMKKIEAALCLPLFRKKKVIGMIVLGNKVSGDPYSQQDLELLTTLSSQASIALQNARLYNQVQDLSQNLQQKVDEQTRELRGAYEELKKLDKAKSEFISIASHQLRTPLTAIKGYISMILEGDYGKLPGKAVQSMENVYQSNERLIKLVNGLLNISRIEAGRIEIKKEQMSIEPLIESLIEELKPQTQQKNLYLKLKKPKIKMPQLLADKEKLRQVLLNVLDNGLRYTTKGGITVKLEIKKSKPFGSELRAELLRIIISDTGEGMSRDELSKIFQTFSRGKAGAKLWVEGIGLGLYIAKRFIELQGGKIWAESSGKGKGSTFYVELPIG